MKHLQFIFKEFDNIATPTNDFLIWYFQYGLRPTVRGQLDKRNRNLDDWQVIVK